MTEYKAGAEGLGGGGEYFKNGRGRLQSGSNVIQEGDTGGATIWIVVLSPIDGNRGNHRRY